MRPPLVLLTATALAVAACAGPVQPSIDDPLGAPDDGVLSDCSPTTDARRVVVVAGDDPPPTVEELEALVFEGAEAALREDLGFRVEEQIADGVDPTLALLDALAQVIGDELFSRARALPGFVEGAGRYARPSEGIPFEIGVSGSEVPDALVVDDLDLGAIGLVVIVDAAGVDTEGDGFFAALEAAQATGMQVVGGSPDAVDGTGRIEVVSATPEQVDAWEEAVDEPERWCLALAARAVACDEEVVAAARAAAPDPRPTLPNEQVDGAPDDARAAEVRASYLGLTVAEAEARAAEEGRAVRVTTVDGVPLGSNDDFQPGRLSLTVCNDVVTDTRMDLEGFEG